MKNIQKYNLIFSFFIFLLSAVTLSDAHSEDCRESDLWRKKYVWCKNNQKDISRRLFEMAEYINTVRGYEMYLASENTQPELENRAVKKIYELVSKADLIEGYQYVLKKYPEPEKEAKAAYERLCSIYYSIAEKQNTVQAYYDFITVFESVPENYRKKSLARLVRLEEQRILDELNSVQGLHQLVKQSEIEKTGRLLYQEAIDAKNKGDYTTFEWKYSTILECDIFEGSEVRFDLQRDKELRKKLDEIQKQIESLRKDFRKSVSIFSAKIDKLLKNQNTQSRYAVHVRLIQGMQNEKISSDLPVIWDRNKGTWENYVNLGLICLKAWKSPEDIISAYLLR